ncbi:putative integral membrane protein [Neofusicoccum parvum UCRNP2]|uniref:Putative integral membrane protein n=1 Tax=Botryosphaeria parva (strain UCR-NP2) TaxID=1287680 RepID=R1GXJ8_BOTPV|nr:putative integral membrane protein [Neofusicoccum parvum UCRNP2]
MALDIVARAAGQRGGPDQGPALRNTTVALLVLAALFVALRFVCRFMRGVAVAFDDWIIVVSLIFCIAEGGLVFGMIAHGLGRHAATLEIPDLVVVLKLLLALECVYLVAVALLKLSLLALYFRLFPTREFKISTYILSGIIVLWCIALNCVAIFQCNPVKKSWLPMTPGTCINLKAAFIGNAIPNIITDVIILLLPIRTLAEASAWCVIETATGIIGACLPVLRPLLRLVSDQFGSEKSGSRTHNRSGSELVTIGGTGASRSKLGGGGGGDQKKHFQRLDDHSGRWGGTTTIISHRRVEGDEGSADEVPLNGILVGKDVAWSERNVIVR